MTMLLMFQVFCAMICWFINGSFSMVGGQLLFDRCTRSLFITVENDFVRVVCHLVWIVLLSSVQMDVSSAGQFPTR